MLFHAWDSSLSPTFVVITGDRDVAYALAMLRMKSFRVVLISPAGSHLDLTAQASVHLDWSRTVLGINDDPNEDGLFPKKSPDRMSSAHAPANSSRPGQDSTFRSELPSTSLRVSPALALKPSIFSSPYDHGLNVFGGPRFASPKSSLGVGDSLLPQSTSQKLRSRSGSLTELLRPTSLANKGKNKAFEDPPPPPPASRSRLWSSASIFGPFDDDELLIPRSSPAAAAVPERGISSNSSGSRRSKFSFEQISKPSEVNTAEPVDRQPFNEGPARLSNEPRGPAVMTSSGVQQKETLPLPLPVPPPPPIIPSTTPTQTQKASTSQKAQRPRASGSSPVASSKPLPPAWVPLIQTLRRHKGVLLKSTIAPTLLQHYPDAFKTAGAKNIKTYLTAAINSGIVLKQSRPNGRCEIILKPSYLP